MLFSVILLYIVMYCFILGGIIFFINISYGQNFNIII